MFKFLKDKLKSVISKTTKKIDEEGETDVVEKSVEVPEKKEGIISKIKDKISKKEDIEERKVEELIEKEKEILDEEIKLEKEKDKKKEIEGKFAEEEIEKFEKPEEKKEEKVEEAPIEKEIKEELKEEVEKELEEEKVEIEKKIEKKEGFFAKVKEKFITKKINEKQFEQLFEELELVLLENNVAYEVIDKIKSDLKVELVDAPLQRNKIEKIIRDTLKESIEELFYLTKADLKEKINSSDNSPFVISFLGINGSGKTTTIAKITDLLMKDGKSVVLAASDTFRAAAIDQLQIHADNLGVKLIKHEYGSDPAAVAFDAIKHAESKKIDVVLIDTAGRIHSNANLMQEMEKIVRVAKPDFKIFVGEAITGNDCTEQAKQFDEAVGIDGIILTKSDVDEKGGASISVSYVTKKPILYLGTGQEYGDIVPFESSIIIDSLGLET